MQAVTAARAAIEYAEVAAATACTYKEGSWNNLRKTLERNKMKGFDIKINMPITFSDTWWFQQWKRK